jgi:hypothetical protein
MEINIWDISIRVDITGCELPTSIQLEGSVISILSFLSSSSKAFFLSSFSFVLRSVSSSSFILFASCPISFLSSGESFPRVFKIVFNFPFFPKNSTLTLLRLSYLQPFL